MVRVQKGHPVCRGNEGTGLAARIKVITWRGLRHSHELRWKAQRHWGRWASGVSFVKAFGKKSCSRLGLGVGRTRGDGIRTGWPTPEPHRALGVNSKALVWVT